jgi:hypothetical protein
VSVSLNSMVFMCLSSNPANTQFLKCHCSKSSATKQFLMGQQRDAVVATRFWHHRMQLFSLFSWDSYLDLYVLHLEGKHTN